MPSRKFAPLAGLALGLLGDPVFAKTPQPLELDAISVTSDDESATGPVASARARTFSNRSKVRHSTFRTRSFSPTTCAACSGRARAKPASRAISPSA